MSALYPCGPQEDRTTVARCEASTALLLDALKADMSRRGLTVGLVEHAGNVVSQAVVVEPFKRCNCCGLAWTEFEFLHVLPAPTNGEFQHVGDMTFLLRQCRCGGTMPVEVTPPPEPTIRELAERATACCEGGRCPACEADDRGDWREMDDVRKGY